MVNVMMMRRRRRMNSKKYKLVNKIQKDMKMMSMMTSTQ